MEDLVRLENEIELAGPDTLGEARDEVGDANHVEGAHHHQILHLAFGEGVLEPVVVTGVDARGNAAHAEDEEQDAA